MVLFLRGSIQAGFRPQVEIGREAGVHPLKIEDLGETTLAKEMAKMHENSDMIRTPGRAPFNESHSHSMILMAGCCA